MEGRKTLLSIAAAGGAVLLLAVLVAFAVRSDSDRTAHPEDSGRPGGPDAELISEPPTVGDHWHAAFGVFKCDAFLAPPADNGRDPHGIHSHGDGIIHIHPFTRQAAGPRATLGVFEDSMSAVFDRDEIRIGADLMLTSQTRCGDKPAQVQVFVDGRPYDGDPSGIRLHDRQTIVIAFAPEGADIPRTPPSAADLDNLTDVPPDT